MAEDCGGIADIDPRDPQMVLRVSFFGDEARELLPQGLRASSVGFFRRASVEKAHPHRRPGREADEGCDRSQRHHPGRQHRVAEQRVQKRAFAAFELPEDRDLKPLLFQALAQRQQPRRLSGGFGPNAIKAGPGAAERRPEAVCPITNSGCGLDQLQPTFQFLRVRPLRKQRTRP